MDYSAVATHASPESEHVLIEVISSDDPTQSNTSPVPVASITSLMRPGGPDPDPFISAEHRITYLLREIGWEPTAPVVIGTPFSVGRHTPFTARVATYEGNPVDLVQIRNNDGEILAEIPVARTPSEALAASGWDVLGAAAGGWPDDTLAVAPNDWKVVVARAKTEREAARREATRREQFWSACLREAVLAGHTATELADIAGVTAQRIYQIRDRRR
ncbi:hypothetical protein ACFU7D_19825 [Nocardioides sp. NPDC057577]|uniref:hypothetical protein n=1 Tax=Nocardioides sp. NPDC057577 TaxID=3346171 RepID=UPI00366B8831